MTAQPYITHNHMDEPFSDMVAYTLDHRKLALKIRVTPHPKQPPHVAITDESERYCWTPHCEKVTMPTDNARAYHYERICVDAHDEYTYWLRLIIVDTTALVPHPEEPLNSDHTAERRQHWTLIPRLEQVREVPAEPITASY